MVTRGRGGSVAIRASAQAMAARARRFRSRTFASKAASAGEVFAALRLPRGAPTVAAPGRGWFLPQFGSGFIKASSCALRASEDVSPDKSAI